MNDELREQERWNDPAAAFLTVRLLIWTEMRCLTWLFATEKEKGQGRTTRFPEICWSSSATESFRYSSWLSLGRRRQSAFASCFCRDALLIGDGSGRATDSSANGCKLRTSVAQGRLKRTPIRVPTCSCAALHTSSSSHRFACSSASRSSLATLVLKKPMSSVSLSRLNLDSTRSRSRAN